MKAPILVLRSLAAAFALTSASACTVEGTFRTPEASFERMIDQPKVDPYEYFGFFPEGRAMLPPPEGTVARESAALDFAVRRGQKDGDYLDQIPIPITRETLARGRNRFEIFCATCHGILGDGVSPVASQMPLVRPPSLLSERIRAFPVGRLYEIGREGYGVMPAYEYEIEAPDLWAVTAYIQVLQRAAATRLDELPGALARRAHEALR